VLFNYINASHSLYFDLNTNVFDTKKQAEVPQHFLNLLDGFIEDSLQDIATVSMITTAEKLQIQAWNNTTRVYPENETLLSKFQD